MKKPRIIVFASGTKDGGGSGCANLINKSRGPNPELDANIVAVVSNHERGGVYEKALALDVPFIHMTRFDADVYCSIMQRYRGEWCALSGWLKMVSGLDPKITFNIHPALLSFQNRRFGGKGMYGHHVHEAVKKALDAGELTESGFSMHFVTPEFDEGPVFAEVRVPLERGMSADDIAKAVNAAEHQWQPHLTNEVVHRRIQLIGRAIVMPHTYRFKPQFY